MMQKKEILNYFKWHKKYLHLGIDIKNVKEMKIFLFGYSKGLKEFTGIENDWVNSFNIWTELELKNLKQYQYDWSAYILENQKDDTDGLKKFYLLLDKFVDQYKILNESNSNEDV